MNLLSRIIPVSWKKRTLSVLLSALVMIVAGVHWIRVHGTAQKLNAVVAITALGSKNTASSASEVWITGIENAGVPYSLDRVTLSGGWFRKDDRIVSSKGQPDSLLLTIEEADHPVITFLRHDWSGRVKLVNGKNEEVVDLYQPGPAGAYRYTVDMGNLKPVVDAGPTFYVWMTLGFLFFSALFSMLLTGKKSGLWLPLLNLIIGYVLFTTPGFLQVGKEPRILLILASWLCGSLFSRAIRENWLKQLRTSQWIFLLCITLYAAFSCTGNDLFVIHSIRTRSICYFILFMLWIFPAEIAFLFVTLRLKELFYQYHQDKAGNSKNNSFRTGTILFFLIPFTIGCMYLYAYFPANMSSDSLDQWLQATGGKHFNDWHPVFHTLFNAFFIRLYKSPASPVLAQILFMSLVVAGFFQALLKKGIPLGWLLFFDVFFSILPPTGIYAVTLWKDFPFTISLLWLTLLLVKLAAEPSYFKSRWAGLQLTVSLVCVALFRHNGTLVYAVVLIVLAFYFFRHRQKWGFIYLAGSILLIGAYEILIIDRADVTPIPAAIKLVAPVHGMAAVLSHQQQLSQDGEKIMDTVLPRETWLRYFSPYSAEDYQFNTDHIFIDRLSAIPAPRLLKAYASGFFLHPGIVLRDRLQGIDLIWDITKPDSAFNYHYVTELLPNSMGLVQHGNQGLKSFLNGYLQTSIDSGGIFIWRVGLQNILLLLTLFFVLNWKNKSKTALLVFLPWAICVCSLLFSMVLQEYRYVYFISYLFLFVWLAVLSDAFLKTEAAGGLGTKLPSRSQDGTMAELL